MQPLVPILATLLSCIVQIEKLNFLKGTGVCVAVLGSIMIASETSTEQV
jgi:drug/metabolite transporter (DMT)-like permease